VIILKIDLKETGWRGVDFIHVSGYGPVVGSFEQGNE
jgi:hypothetical protein